MNDETTNQPDPDPKRNRVGDHVVIFPRGKRGIWCADYHIGQHHVRKSLGTRNRKIAEQRARELEVKLCGGEVKLDLNPA